MHAPPPSVHRGGAPKGRGRSKRSAEYKNIVEESLRATLGTPSRLCRTPSINRGRVSG